MPEWFTQQTQLYQPNAGLILGDRLGRWPNINPALDQCVVLAG